MTPIERQLHDLKQQYPETVATLQASGGWVIEVRKYRLPPGWNHSVVTVVFFAPPGYPAAHPVPPGPGGVRDRLGVPPGGRRPRPGRVRGATTRIDPAFTH